jgi:hypothetical protein
MSIISIILPNTDSVLIKRSLHVLGQQVQDRSTCEILVVGTDKPGLVVEDDLVRMVPTDSSACASDKRNLGMREASGRILMFLDDDCLPAPDWLTRHVERHNRGELVAGGAVTFDSYNYFQLADNVSAFHDLLPFMPEGPRAYLTTANLSVDRRVIEHAGEMEPQKNRAEDLEWTVRFRTLGYRLYFDPAAVVYHDPPRRSLNTVWHHWTEDAPHTLKIRLRHAELLQTPSLARHRWVLLCGMPMVAAWATMRTFSHLETISRYWSTLPLVYLTKMAWCWGAFRRFPKDALRGTRG